MHSTLRDTHSAPNANITFFSFKKKKEYPQVSIICRGRPPFFEICRCITLDLIRKNPPLDLSCLNTGFGTTMDVLSQIQNNHTDLVFITQSYDEDTRERERDR